MGASGVIGNFFFGGGGGGGGTVTNGFSPNTSAGLTDGGFNCGGQGGTGAGDFSEDNDGHAGFCPGGGGGGGVAENIGILAESGNGANGNYGGGGGGGGYASGNGGDGGFGGGGGSSMDFLGTTSGSGGNGGFGGGGGGGQGGIIFGGPGHGGTFAGNGDAGHGGGGAALGSVIFNDSGSVVVRNSTFTGNSVYRGDSGGGSSEHGSDAGAAIFSVNGHLTVLNATISFNHATGTGAGVVLLQIGLPPPPASFILENTIISNNSSMECAFAGFSISGGGAGNLIQNNDDCPGVVSSSDPLLGPLQNNVGFTPTMAIPKTSPAFNAADPATSLATDQRGQARPALGGFDIGAFELCQNFFGIPCVISAGIEQTEPLTVVISPPAAGKTTPPAGVTNEPLGSVTVLTATGNPGFSFIDWTGNVTDATNPSTTIIMSEAQTVTANFVSCGCAGDVSASITLSRGGFVLNPATGRYTQTVVLTNYSASIITGPISLVLDSLSANATLLNATGTTDSLESPAGSPYLSANVNLAPGQTTSLALQFTDPTHGTITYDTRVLAGPGAR